MNHKVIYTLNPLWLIKIDETRIENQMNQNVSTLKKKENKII